MDSLPSSQKEKKEKCLFRNDTSKINKGESIFVTCRDLVSL